MTRGIAVAAGAIAFFGWFLIVTLVVPGSDGPATNVAVAVAGAVVGAVVATSERRRWDGGVAATLGAYLTYRLVGRSEITPVALVLAGAGALAATWMAPRLPRMSAVRGAVLANGVSLGLGFWLVALFPRDPNVVYIAVFGGVFGSGFLAQLSIAGTHPIACSTGAAALVLLAIASGYPHLVPFALATTPLAITGAWLAAQLRRHGGPPETLAM